MAISLHAATVPAYLQMLAAVSQLIDKAEAHCAAKGIAPATLIDARLAPDMLPLGFQLQQTVVHSLRAIEGVRKGVFSPHRAAWRDSFAGFREDVAGAREALAAIDPAEMEGLLRRPMRFEVGDLKLDFSAEDFLLSFSQPNFYFHVTTTYAILRKEGVEIGKRDYLGPVRLKS